MRKNIDWDAAFKKYSELGLSDAAFCKQENIPTTSFYKQKKLGVLPELIGGENQSVSQAQNLNSLN